MLVLQITKAVILEESKIKLIFLTLKLHTLVLLIKCFESEYVNQNYLHEYWNDTYIMYVRSEIGHVLYKTIIMKKYVNVFQY